MSSHFYTHYVGLCWLSVHVCCFVNTTVLLLIIFRSVFADCFRIKYLKLHMLAVVDTSVPHLNK